jgi:hypothetical protein
LGCAAGPTNGTDKDEQWMRLIENFAAMEIRYFDPRINSWLERGRIKMFARRWFGSGSGGARTRSLTKPCSTSRQR